MAVLRISAKFLNRSPAVKQSQDDLYFTHLKSYRGDDKFPEGLGITKSGRYHKAWLKYQTQFATTVAALDFIFSEFSILIYRHWQGRSDRYSVARSHTLQQGQDLQE